MATSTRSTINIPFEKLIAHLKTPLYRNGYALVLSSGLTSAIGMVYWILAARLYAPSVVGLNSALISAMTFLAGIAQLNLMSALIRFIPGAGKRTRSFVLYTYLISLVGAVIISLAFLLGVHRWAPELGFLGSSGGLTLGFILATMAWCIFVLQDSVLTGLRRATWVPIENTVYAIGKIVLLVVFAIAIPTLGIFASWTIALIVSLIPVNALIFARLIPRHIRGSEDTASSLTTRQVVKFAAPDYLGATLWLICTTLLPVIVTARLGAEANAYFYLPWTIAYSLYLVSPNIGSSLIVEASTQPSQLNSYSYRAFLQIARLVLPLAGVLVIGAPIILHIFGGSYSFHGATLLRLLAASAIPNMVNALYVSVARVQRHMKSVVATLGSICFLVLLITFLLLPVEGIQGVGWAWLIGQSLVAVVITITQLRRLWSIQSPLAGKELWSGSPRHIPHLIGNRLIHLAHRAIMRLHLYTLLRQPREILTRAKLLAQISGVTLGILKLIPEDIDSSMPASWVIHSFVRTVTDMTVVTLGPVNTHAIAVLKIPRTANGYVSAQKQKVVLAELSADPRLIDWEVRFPKILAEGNFNGQSFAVEEKLAGIDGRRWLYQGGDPTELLVGAYNAICGLHQRTTRLVVVDDNLFNCWIDQPVETILNAIEKPLHKSSLIQPFDRLSTELRQALQGKTLAVSWTHGDFVPANILVDGDSNKITGIVDWELARDNDIPMLDLMQLLLSTSMLVKRREMGEIVRRRLNGNPWTPEDLALIDKAQRYTPGDRIDLRTLLLLCWLRHVTGNLTKSTWYAGHWLWLAENLEAVLQCI